MHFRFAPSEISSQIKAYEKLYENLVFDSGRRDLHNNFCGGQTELPQDREELPHERQQEMQLREDLRL
jgi:hypothetical protein